MESKTATEKKQKWSGTVPANAPEGGDIEEEDRLGGGERERSESRANPLTESGGPSQLTSFRAVLSTLIQ